MQGRLIRSVLAVLTLIWLIAAGVTWIDARHEVNELLDAHLAQSAALLLVQRYGDFDDDDIVADRLAVRQPQPTVLFQVFQAGKLVLRSDDAPAQPVSGGAAPGYRTVAAGGTAWRVFAAADRSRDLLVLVAERSAARQSILWAVLRSTLWPLVVALPLLAVASWAVVRHGLAPLRALGQAVQARQPAALAPIVADGLTSELQPLLSSLNDLLGRVSVLLESERRFTADAAHELRTPIAAIRVQAQVAAAEADPAARQHALAATVSGCDRAARLVDQLLTLSRLEANGVTELTRVDLREVVRQVVAALAPQAGYKRQELRLEAGLACPVWGNDILLALLARNLIDNAIRYSPTSASIHVRLTCEHAQFALEVDDSGPGLSQPQLARLGERFFRVPGSGESGSGLGWSIARRICQAHGFALAAAPSARLGGMMARVSGRVHDEA